MTDPHTPSDVLARRFDRRTMLRGSLLGGAGIAAAALIGCGGSSGEEDDSAVSLAELRARRAASGGAPASAAAAGHDAPAAADSHAAPAAGEAPHWTYAGAGGPDEWGDLGAEFSACSAGRNQSPINITKTAGVGAADVAFHYQHAALTVINNGHTIQANVPPGNSITVDGKDFGLLQFHFHSPSEHTLDGHSFPLEMHLVHRDLDGNLGVVGVLFADGQESAELAPVWNVMPDNTTEQGIVEGFAIESLLPSTHQLFRYSGSLTTPPCSEGVRWMLMQSSRTVSSAQVQAFSGLVGPNNRPIQALWAREVLQEGSPSIAGSR